MIQKMEHFIQQLRVSTDTFREEAATFRNGGQEHFALQLDRIVAEAERIIGDYEATHA